MNMNPKSPPHAIPVDQPRVIPKPRSHEQTFPMGPPLDVQFTDLILAWKKNNNNNTEVPRLRTSPAGPGKATCVVLLRVTTSRLVKQNKTKQLTSDVDWIKGSELLASMVQTQATQVHMRNTPREKCNLPRSLGASWLYETRPTAPVVEDSRVWGSQEVNRRSRRSLRMVCCVLFVS